MSIRRARRFRGRTAVLAAAAVGVLGLTSACGVSAATVRPGVAASVDGADIPMSTVDKATRAYCQLVSKSHLVPPQPGAAVRSSLLQNLVLRAVADRINEESYHVQPGSFYRQAVSTDQEQLNMLPQEQQSDLFDAYTGFSYFVDLAQQFGAASGNAQVPAGNTDPQVKEQADLKAGIDVVQQWVTDHPISTDPQFPSLTVGDNQVEQASQDLSKPQSQAALLPVEVANQPTPTGSAAAYVDSLPASQICG